MTESPTQAGESPSSEPVTGQQPSGSGDAATAEGAEPEVMPGTDPDALRAEVRRLRDENAAARVRGRQGDEYARRLHVELVRSTGRLADPDDLPYDAAHLEDADALATAVEELLARKPHLASRRPSGDVGQGAREQGSEGPGLAAMLRAGAG